jgi:hypothetical protein
MTKVWISDIAHFPSFSTISTQSGPSRWRLLRSFLKQSGHKGCDPHGRSADAMRIGQSKRNGVEMVQCQQSNVSINGAPHDDPARSNDDPARNDDSAAGDDGAARPSATGAINTASADNGVRLFDGGHHGPHYNEGGGDGYHRLFHLETP